MNAGGLDRRSALNLGAFALAAPLAGLTRRRAWAADTGSGEQASLADSPYGPPAPTPDLSTGLDLLQLPEGFSYRSLSWRGDAMNDGQRVAPGHDGMAVVQAADGEHVLIRNHELIGGQRQSVPGNPRGVYSTLGNCGGGCSVLRVRDGVVVDHRQAIAGTVVNCAGGRSLWGSWLTCEEANIDASPSMDAHGYVFDVNADPSRTVARPIVGMGRFKHEANASDPATGHVYMTEDHKTASGFYRYKPTSRLRAYGELAKGGTLQMAKVVGVDKANLLALAGPKPSDVRTVGQSLQIEWVDIPTPDAGAAEIVENGVGNPLTGTISVAGPFAQGRAKGALRMARGEGIWWDARGACFYLTDTTFGYDAGGVPGSGLGAVWAYAPDRTDPETGTLTLIYASSTALVGNNPDNITVSPRGGILYCEDGGRRIDPYGRGMRLMGLTPQGKAFIFAKNNVQLSAGQLAAMGRTGHPFSPAPGDYRDTEFAGAAFDPLGRVLYVNTQAPGITYAVTGPWNKGNL